MIHTPSALPQSTVSNNAPGVSLLRIRLGLGTDAIRGERRSLRPNVNRNRDEAASGPMLPLGGAMGFSCPDASSRP